MMRFVCVLCFSQQCATQIKFHDCGSARDFFQKPATLNNMEWSESPRMASYRGGVIYCKRILF